MKISCVKYSNPNKFNGNDDEISSKDSEKSDYSGMKTDGYQVTYSKWSRIAKKMQKITLTEDRSDCVGSWKNSVRSLKQHIFEGLTSCFSD